MKKLLCILIIIIISFLFISCENDPYQAELNKLNYSYERAHNKLEERMENERKDLFNDENAKDELRQMGVDEDKIGEMLAGAWIITEDTKYEPMFRELEEQYQKDIESLKKKYNIETSNKNDIENETINPVNISNDDEMKLLKQLIIDFDNAWIDYINNNSSNIFEYIIPNSGAEKDIYGFNKDGVKEEFLNIEVKDIEVKGNDAYIKVYEKIKKIQNNEGIIKEHNWIYHCQKVNGKWLISDYTKDTNQKLEKEPVVERIKTDQGGVIEATYTPQEEDPVKVADKQEYIKALEHMEQLSKDGHVVFWDARIAYRDTGDIAKFKTEMEAISGIYKVSYEDFKKVGIPADEESKAIHEKAIAVFDFYYEHFNFILLAIGEEDYDEVLKLIDSYEQGMYEAETTMRDYLRIYIQNRQEF